MEKNKEWAGSPINMEYPGRLSHLYWMKMLKDNDPDKSKRVMEAMMKMDKMDIKKFKQAYEG